MSIGKNVKIFRLNNKLTQEELAGMVNVNRSMIAQIERDTKTLTLPLGNDIANALNCTAYDLLDNKLQQAIK